jgi:SP family general alpha glucoside:H+ symporter-like MFS transporter
VTTIFFTAPNVEALLAAEVLAGVPWGVFQASTPFSLCFPSLADDQVAISYAAEVCPIALRGYVTTYLNFCWGWGQLLGVGVIKSMFGRTDQWAYRIPYGLMVSSFISLSS